MSKKKKNRSPRENFTQINHAIETAIKIVPSTPETGISESPPRRENPALFRKILRRCGSMVVAILLTSALMAILAWATFVENAYGAQVSRFVIYRSWWFDAIVGLLAGNILCSMTSQLQWRRLPFLAAHLGILLLILGCFITSRWGIEAQLTVFEGELSRFAQKISDGEIQLAVNDFHATKKEETSAISMNATDAASLTLEDSVKEILDAENNVKRDPSKIKPPGSMLQEELDVLQQYPQIRIPVVTGPMSWREYLSKNWFVENRKFAAALYLPMRLAHRTKGAIYQKDGATVELLDYLADSRLQPAKQLKLRIQTIKPTDSSVSEKQDKNDDPKNWKEITLPLGVAADDSRREDLYLAPPIPNERITYRLAKTRAEQDAFLNMPPYETPSGTWGNLIVRLGGKNHTFNMDELIKLQEEYGEQIDRAASAKQQSEWQLSELRGKLLGLNVSQNVSNKPKNADNKESYEKTKTEIATVENALKELEKTFAEQEKTLRELESHVRLPIGETGLTLEMTQFRPDLLAAMLQIRKANEPPQRLALFADRPLTSTFAESLGLYAMFALNPKKPIHDAPGLAPPLTLERASQPRLDLMQGKDKADRSVYYRFWDGEKYAKSGRFYSCFTPYYNDKRDAVLYDTELPPQTISFVGAEQSIWNIEVAEYEPHDYPGYTIVPKPFQKTSETGTPPQRRVKVRVTADGVGDETFWLASGMFLTPLSGLPETHVGYVSGKDRTVAVTFPATYLDLGFSVYLQKFERKFDPGTSMASHYSSLVGIYPPDEKRADTTSQPPLYKEALIRMNQPGMFADKTAGRKYRLFQSSYRGPFPPGSPEYDQFLGGYLLNGETSPRKALYATVLSVNYDPGRGLKYLGCLLIVLGSFALFYTKRRKISC
ncbi:MAG: cytochrome c biogenesis protein ResB [Planctomycetaceae bacterium]|jgi:uncharacterized coiled-coil protein SlyX|nr:cytochrome c biogenesis protein ResB [Planctomycetaceae bacterium]